MNPARLAACSLFVALALTRASAVLAADAQPTPGQVQAARDLFAAASKDEEAGRWADALEKLRRVADVKLTAGIRYHLAFCEEKLGQTATALAHYTEAREAAQREHNKDVLALLDDPFLTELRARVPSLTLVVPRDATGAEVTLDGHSHPPGLWGVPVPIDPGTHRVEAIAPGRKPFTRELAVHDREITMLDVTLTPMPTPTPMRTQMPTQTPTPTRTPTPTPTQTQTPTPTRTRSQPPIAAAVLATTGAVLFAGGGVAAFLVAGSAQDDGRAQCLTRTRCDDLRGPVRTWDTVALGAWVGAAVLATTAVVLWTSTPARGRVGDAREVRVAAGVAQLRLEGSF